jgi:hypothetical protein
VSSGSYQKQFKGEENKAREVCEGVKKPLYYEKHSVTNNVAESSCLIEISQKIAESTNRHIFGCRYIKYTIKTKGELYEHDSRKGHDQSQRRYHVAY